MFLIRFKWLCSRPEVYSGSTYIYQGEKYAAFDTFNPKLYKSAKVAENSAKKLQESCINLLGSEYEIEEVEGE